MILPFSTSRSSTRLMSNFLISESRTPMAMFSRSQNSAIFFSSLTDELLSGAETTISRLIRSISSGEKSKVRSSSSSDSWSRRRGPERFSPPRPSTAWGPPRPFSSPSSASRGRRGPRRRERGRGRPAGRTRPPSSPGSAVASRGSSAPSSGRSSTGAGAAARCCGSAARSAAGAGCELSWGSGVSCSFGRSSAVSSCAPSAVGRNHHGFKIVLPFWPRAPVSAQLRGRWDGGLRCGRRRRVFGSQGEGTVGGVSRRTASGERRGGPQRESSITARARRGAETPGMGSAGSV